jgi:hypothetical protein
VLPTGVLPNVIQGLRQPYHATPFRRLLVDLFGGGDTTKAYLQLLLTSFVGRSNCSMTHVKRSVNVHLFGKLQSFLDALPRLT